MGDVSDEALLKEFLAEVSEVGRDNEVNRVLGCFKLNPYEHLNLPFDSEVEDVKKQYRKISLMIHPDKCKHPKAKEAFAALAKAQQLATDPQEREYIVGMCKVAKDELKAERKKRLKKNSSLKLKPLGDDALVFAEYEKTVDFREKWKLKVREMMTEQEWKRRKMQMRITEEEGKLKVEEEETREMYKRKREHEAKWEETRETRVSSWRNYQKGGRAVSKELKPPKLKTEDPNKSYVQRPVKKG